MHDLYRWLLENIKVYHMQTQGILPLPLFILWAYHVYPYCYIRMCN